MIRVILGRVLSCMVFLASTGVAAQTKDEGPTSDKAKKTYQEALVYLTRHANGMALESFRKADKQDDGHCAGCQKQIIKYAIEEKDWKAAEAAAKELIDGAQGTEQTAIAHYHSGEVWTREAVERHQEDLFKNAHEEMSLALASAPNFPNAVYGDGLALAHLNQDEAAKARFQQYVKMSSGDEVSRQRALVYINQPELARAHMAPPFSVTTMDGQTISLDSLRGRVVLVDFWATWCGPCREALPSLQRIVQKFQGEPMVVLSVSLDKDESKWKDFVAKNKMTWPQYWDNEFHGQLATSFGVHAIPQTFTIDADGILQDQRIGDLAIEGKLKKLVTRARELHTAQVPK